MPTVIVQEENSIIRSDFTDMYNKWLQELINIEKKLLLKAKEIQHFQNSLYKEAEMLKRLHDTQTPTQIEQNYLEDLLKAFLVEQDELGRELANLEDIERVHLETSNEEYEECPVIFESVETELKKLKESVRTIVNELNNNTDKLYKTKSPFSMYRIVLDHYADALHLLSKNSMEIREKLDELNTLRIQYFIPPNAFSSPI